MNLKRKSSEVVPRYRGTTKNERVPCPHPHRLSRTWHRVYDVFRCPTRPAWYPEDHEGNDKEQRGRCANARSRVQGGGQRVGRIGTHIGTDGCGCRLAMTAPARAAMESAARKTKALATALRTRSTDVRAVHGGLDTTDREDAGRLANA